MTQYRCRFISPAGWEAICGVGIGVMLGALFLLHVEWTGQRIDARAAADAPTAITTTDR